MAIPYHIGESGRAGKTALYIIGFVVGFLTVCAAGGWMSLFAQSYPHSGEVYVSDEYVLDRWTIADGLPVNSIEQVYQSSDGYIWIVTYNGIARFDGVSFTVFNTDTHPGLPGNRFRSMLETPDGTLWFETEGPNLLLSFNENRFRLWGTKNGLAGDQVLDFQLGPDGTLWIGTESGISAYNDGVMRPFHPDRIPGRVDRVFPESESTLFLRHENRISRFDGDSLYTMIEDLQSDQPYHMPFLRLRDGSMLFGADTGLYAVGPSYGPDTAGHLIHPISGENDRIRDIHKTRDGSILFNVHQTGFYRWDRPGEPRLYQGYDEGIEGLTSRLIFTTAGSDTWKVTRQQLFRNRTLILHLSDSITRYLHDREGSIWVGTYSSGLVRLKPNPFQTYSVPEGLSDRNVYPVLETRDGDILTGSMFGGLHRIGPEGRVSNFGANAQVRALRQLHDGTILAGKDDPFVYEFSNGNLIPWKADSAHIPASINAMYEDEDHRVWVGAGSGLFMYTPSQAGHTGGGWRNLTEELPVPPHPVRYFAPAPDGMLWMATAGGGVFGLSSAGEPVFHPLDFPADFVRSIYVEANSSFDSPSAEKTASFTKNGYTLWIGTEGHGLFRLLWDADRQEVVHMSHIRRRDGLPDNTIHQILDDGDGNFWMSTNSGIFKADISVLHEWCEGRRSMLQITTFAEGDGMRNREANGGVQPAGMRASDGRLWYPTQEGVVVIDPETIRGNERPPPVKIEHLTADTMQVVFPDHVELRGDQRNFEIHYAGLSYLVPEKVTFSYKLDGFDTGWNHAGTRRTAYYTNVPPGTYQFQVTAVNNDGVQSTEPAKAEIVVHPYFHETLWFWLMMMAAGVSLISGGIWFRFRKMKRDEILLRETVDVRTAELKGALGRLEEQARHLSELDEAKSRFFTNMSHEFRTPLTLMLGPLEKLLSRTGPYCPEQLNQDLSMIKRNGHRLERLIEQVLDLAKLDSGNLTPDLRSFNVQKHVYEVAELFRALTEGQGIALTVSGNAPETAIVADIDKMEHILANLLSNAIKYTGEGGRIEVRTADSASRVHISVTDTGKGISKEHLGRIFDRFYQVDDGKNRPAEGMGIGLALCKEFMALHHGTISAESEPGKGSTFTLEFLKGTDHYREAGLDLSSAGAAPSASTRRSDKFPASARLPANGKGLEEADSTLRDTPRYSRDRTTLLIADDHQDMRDFLRILLMDNYKILEASNGEEALSIIQKSPPDLIIADIMMPVMDGLAFSRHLREAPLHRNIPLLFLTARSAKTDEIEALHQGGSDYLPKPFHPDVLRARVAALLASQQRLREQVLMENSVTNGQIDTEKPVPDNLHRGDSDIDWLRVLTYHMKRNMYDPGFGVVQLAAFMRIDSSQLYRQVKKHTGRSPVQLIKEARLQKARKLIKNGSTNYSEIAYACGFNSLSYFSRSYKKHFGYSPSDQKHLHE